MKLYSRTSQIYGLICGLIIIFEWKHYDGAKSILWMAFFGYLGFRSLLTAFSAEASARQAELGERDERVRRKLMGPLGRFAEWIALGLCIMGVALYALLWRYEIAGVLLFVCFVAATVFALWFNVKYRDLMKEENDEDTKS